MFVWRAATLLDCLRRYEPEIHAGLMRIAEAWGTPKQQQVLSEVYPGLKKISVDFAVMEPASRDPLVKVLAVPMPLKWVDVGSWNAFAETCPHDENGNALGAAQHLLLHTKRTLVASSDPKHLIATLGCEDLIIVHTPDTTLVCRADQAENIKELHKLVGQKHGEQSSSRMSNAAATLRATLDHDPVPLKFGTSGRRGLVADLTQLEVYITATAELEYLQSLPKSEGGIVRGEEFYFACDLRPSSSEVIIEYGKARGGLAQAIAWAIADSGMKPRVPWSHPHAGVGELRV